MHFKLTISCILALAVISTAIPIASPAADADANAATRVYAANDVNLKAIGAGYKRDPNAGMQSSSISSSSTQRSALSTQNAEALPRVDAAENVDLEAGYKRREADAEAAPRIRAADDVNLMAIGAGY